MSREHPSWCGAAPIHGTADRRCRCRCAELVAAGWGCVSQLRRRDASPRLSTSLLRVSSARSSSAPLLRLFSDAYWSSGDLRWPGAGDGTGDVLRGAPPAAPLTDDGRSPAPSCQRRHRRRRLHQQPSGGGSTGGEGEGEEEAEKSRTPVGGSGTRDGPTCPG